MRFEALSALVALAAFSAAIQSPHDAVAQETASPAAAPDDVYLSRKFEETPRRIIYTAARSLGMLRGIHETDLFYRLRYKGAGIAYAPAKTGPWKPSPIKYYAEISYPQQAMRVDENLGAGRQIHVVVGNQAWDEKDIAADGPPAGKTKVMTPDALNRRQLYLAMTPYGAIKAAHANIVKLKMTSQPHGIYVLTFPYMGTTMTVTLDRNRRPSKVEAPYVDPVLGKTVLSFEYSGYKDYEPITPTSDEEFSFLYFPAHIVRKLGGKTSIELNVDTCWCTNPYVYFPRPAAPPAPNQLVMADAAKTPRNADGHPDLTGTWRRIDPDGGVVGRAFTVGRPQDNAAGGSETTWVTRQGNDNYLEVDAEYIVKSDEDMPAYKPDYWDRIHDLEENAYRRPADPQYGCKNQGLVRLGAPQEAFSTPTKLAFLYTPNMAIPWYREVSTNGKRLPKPDDYQGVFPVGASVGHWDGDTLVVETVDFPGGEGVWYTGRGWIGSAEAKITERYHRVGNRVTYDITVDDPAFYEPWTRPTQTFEIDRAGMLAQPLTCIEYDGNYLPPSN
jgi:hypothetical protein